MRPVLEAATAGPRKISDVVDEISKRLQLTAEETAQLLPSAKQSVIANRVHWARSYLQQAGLVASPQRAWYDLTERGRQALASPATKINNAYLGQFDEFQAFKGRNREQGDEGSAAVELSAASTAVATPDESLQEAHSRLNAALAVNLLESVRGASPTFFEALIVKLFLAMGYGGTSQETGRALGQAGDGGVNGVIDQDPLGVDQVYLQAKRYAVGNNVGPGEVRDFYGALSIKRTTKGIFVTTSAFTPAAVQTASALGSRIVLIDGLQLAGLMIRYNIGCRDKEVLHIKEIDWGFFQEDEA
jgi:restriction system protein